MLHAKEHARISKKSRLGARLLMSSQLSSVPGGGNILIILIAGIRVIVYDRKKEAGEHTTSTTPPGFSIRSCIRYSEPFSEQAQLLLILRLLS